MKIKGKQDIISIIIIIICAFLILYFLFNKYYKYNYNKNHNEEIELFGVFPNKENTVSEGQWAKYQGKYIQDKIEYIDNISYKVNGIKYYNSNYMEKHNIPIIGAKDDYKPRFGMVSTDFEDCKFVLLNIALKIDDYSLKTMEESNGLYFSVGNLCLIYKNKVNDKWWSTSNVLLGNREFIDDDHKYNSVKVVKGKEYTYTLGYYIPKDAVTDNIYFGYNANSLYDNNGKEQKTPYKVQYVKLQNTELGN